MADIQVPSNLGPQHEGILDKTLGEVLKENPQAQGMIMQSMHLSPEKFQQMLTMAQGNALMDTKIRDLFSKGIVQQAIAQQGKNAQQVSQGPTSQVSSDAQSPVQAQIVQQTQPPQQASFMQRIKSLLGL